MRNEKEIRKELKRIKIAYNLPEIGKDDSRLYHIQTTLNWILYSGFCSPSNYPFDNIDKFLEAWKPERRVKARRSLYPRSDGRRHNVDRRDST